MSSSAIGLGCLLFFAVSQGARDAFFGSAFQSISFLLVATLAFGASTICFISVTWWHRPQDLEKLLRSPRGFAALNVTTAAAWLTFFFGLKHLEPAVVATLYNGVGPLVILGLEGLGWVERRGGALRGEQLCYLGIAAALAGIVGVVLSNRSGLPDACLITQLIALGAVVAGGITIAISHMFARWFNDRGVGSHAVMGTRFLLALVVAGSAEWALSNPELRPALSSVPILALIAFTLITLPSFMLQLGIARASPLAVNVMRALGPVFVFLVQQLDGRLRFSGPTLVCVTAFCIFAAGASVLRGWNEIRAG